jgi:hypothetical protein
MNARRIVVRIVLLLAAVTLVASLVVVSSRRTVAADRKAAKGVTYGYELESYRFRDRTFLRIWNSSGLELNFDLTGYSLRGVDEARWLVSDTVIYLRTSMVQRDGSSDKSGVLKLLYDFRSGELLLSSPLQLWRVSAESVPAAWITDEKFEAALAVKNGGR